MIQDMDAVITLKKEIFYDTQVTLSAIEKKIYCYNHASNCYVEHCAIG